METFYIFSRTPMNISMTAFATFGMKAERRGWGLEILAHPGSVQLKENLAKVTNEDDYRFFTSPAREEEGKAFLLLKETEMP